MPYTAEIRRDNPSCFLFLIDQSGSMQDPFGGGESTKRKSDGVADIINRLLQNLSITCAKSEGIRDYFHVGVIGYGTKVGPAFIGPLVGKELVPISEVASFPARIEERTKKVEDGAGGLVDQTIKFPIWFDPVAEGGTPMCQAMNHAQAILSDWLTQHPNCFPPIVINITDGESTDGDPTSAANAITSLCSSDGNVLLFNAHVSSQHDKPIEFPDSEIALPDQYAQLLFQISSPLTANMRSYAQGMAIPVSDGSRGFVFKGKIESVIRLIDIGTRPSNLR